MAPCDFGHCVVNAFDGMYRMRSTIFASEMNRHPISATLGKSMMVDINFG
jgi:hypothetical protein